MEQCADQTSVKSDVHGVPAALETPIVLIVFNRPFQTSRVFERIAEARPKRLLVVADGPREDRPGEQARCEEVLGIVSAVDWPCQVSTNISEKNLGCRARIVSGLKWAFSQVEEAIVLEDDVLPHPSFFPFCGEMLERYRHEERVGMVTGFNIVADVARSTHSYYFSAMTHIWGWASWRRAWQSYDAEMRCWPEVRRSAAFEEAFPESSVQRYWRYVLDEVYRGEGPDTWDYQWMLTNIRQRRLAVSPQVNLIENIGFGTEATHVTEASEAPAVSTRALRFPLEHPPELCASPDLDRLDQQLSGWHRSTFPVRAHRKLSRLVRGLGKAAA